MRGAEAPLQLARTISEAAGPAATALVREARLASIGELIVAPKFLASHHHDQTAPRLIDAPATTAAARHTVTPRAMAQGGVGMDEAVPALTSPVTTGPSSSTMEIQRLSRPAIARTAEVPPLCGRC
ncbi:hypothetical protein GCM10010121_092410 [Streptomyces brasiliensis]|uniref:Uncharacterized protein n=1 Tax=Streptomyces brasiliensis TaxID=1954 RepID=A0A917P927_9ACTN|nr:hypothetical protein GCM10010121_092410 [Streptomyces brasiliensis]